MKMYTENGSELSKEKFVEYYNLRYYLCDKSPKVIAANGKAVGKTSPYIEGQIDAILKDGITEKQQIPQILAWKLGKIKQKASEEEKRFVYASDWKRAEYFEARRYGQPFELKKISDFIWEKREDFYEEAVSNKDPQKVLIDLRDNFNSQGVKYLGSVYLVTLLYFLSRGAYPIYDRFAMMALKAIEQDTAPKEKISIQNLPDKNSNQFNTLCDDFLYPYIELMAKEFPETQKLGNTNRDLDRALWVYGHLFLTQ